MTASQRGLRRARQRYLTEERLQRGQAFDFDHVRRERGARVRTVTGAVERRTVVGAHALDVNLRFLPLSPSSFAARAGAFLREDAAL